MLWLLLMLMLLSSSASLLPPGLPFSRSHVSQDAGPDVRLLSSFLFCTACLAHAWFGHCLLCLGCLGVDLFIGCGCRKPCPQAMVTQGPSTLKFEALCCAVLCVPWADCQSGCGDVVDGRRWNGRC